MGVKNKRLTAFLAKSGVIAALYAATTLVLYPLSYGPIQCRISEAMTLLPLLFIEAVPGLIVGCLIANIFSGVAMDMVFGTLATAIASIMTYFIGKAIKNKAAPFVAAAPPVLVNAFILPFMWQLFTDNAGVYWYNFASVAAGQFISVYILGIPLYFALRHRLIGNKQN